MAIERFLNHRFLTSNVLFRVFLPLIALILVLVAKFYIFVVTPNEKVMGAVQKIFYFHVGSAASAYLMIGILFVASIFYLRTKKHVWDIVAHSAGSVALLFCSMVLASGMIWAHSAWNTWWRWEPRLVSFLVLWMIVCSYVLLRLFTESVPKHRNFAAVIGIIAAVHVPIVVLSIKFVEHSQQLHPEVVAKAGLQDVRFVYALILGITAVCAVSIWLFVCTVINRLLEKELEDQAK